jgi:hypothetical protein
MHIKFTSDPTEKRPWQVTSNRRPYARDIYFLLQTCNFWYFSAPSLLSLRAAIYSPVAFVRRLCWLSHIKLRSGRSADLRSLRWYSTERRLAGVGYFLSIHLLTRGKANGFYTFAPEMEELVRRGSNLAGSRITRGKHTRSPSSRPTSKILCPALTCVT